MRAKYDGRRFTAERSPLLFPVSFWISFQGLRDAKLKEMLPKLQGAFYSVDIGFYDEK